MISWSDRNTASFPTIASPRFFQSWSPLFRSCLVPQFWCEKPPVEPGLFLRLMTGSAGGYQVGFQLTPLGPNGDLTAHDFKGGPHPVEKDPIFHLCTENREKGYGANKISCFVGPEPKDVVYNKFVRLASWKNYGNCFSHLSSKI